MSHWRELYREEAEHKERLRSATSLPLGLLTLVGGGLGAMLKDFRSDFGWLGIFWPLVLSAIAIASVGIYRLIKVMHGYTYKFMPSAEEQRRHRLQLRTWHEQYSPGDQLETEVEKDFQAWLDERYAEAAEANFYKNAERSEHLYLANRAAIWCVVFSLLAFVPFVIHSQLSEPPIHRVRLMSNPDSTTPKPPPVTQPPPKQPPPPPKPQGPPLKDLREGNIPTPIYPPRVPLDR